MKKAFKLNSAISTGVSMAVAGAGSAVVDWALEKYNLVPAEWQKTTVNIVKIAGGAVLGSMFDAKKWYGVPKAIGDGVATVAAANLVSSLLPENSTDAASGLPEGTIGRLRMGQRGFRRARVAGLGVQNGVIAK